MEQKSAEQKLCDPAEQKSVEQNLCALAEQKLVSETFGLWVMGDIQVKVQKCQSGTKMSGTKIVWPSKTKIGRTKIGGVLQTLGWWGPTSLSAKRSEQNKKCLEQKLCDPVEQKSTE